MLVSAANQILVDAAKDLQRGGTVDGTQFSTGFWRPNDRDSFRCCFFAHFSSPNSRRISSCGMPSPRASDVRARSIAAAVCGVISCSSTAARSKGLTIVSSSWTTAATCRESSWSRSHVHAACQLPSRIHLKLVLWGWHKAILTIPSWACSMYSVNAILLHQPGFRLLYGYGHVYVLLYVYERAAGEEQSYLDSIKFDNSRAALKERPFRLLLL